MSILDVVLLSSSRVDNKLFVVSCRPYFCVFLSLSISFYSHHTAKTQVIPQKTQKGCYTYGSQYELEQSAQSEAGAVGHPAEIHKLCQR